MPKFFPIRNFFGGENANVRRLIFKGLEVMKIHRLVRGQHHVVLQREYMTSGCHINVAMASQDNFLWQSCNRWLF
ncbi:hypothetical protein A2V82_08130 [candidate division KSB1 bacterium RBG_16_48_16]|nr:MAG: hypothetical protein A2V82_08130 [candidate division KSB1 bacterium RBG_16_48_16]